MSKVFGWLLGIGTLFGAFYLWLSKRNDISSLKTALEVQKTREVVARREAELDEQLANAAVSQQQIDNLHADIAALKASAVELATGKDLGSKSDQEIAQIFTDSGL